MISHVKLDEILFYRKLQDVFSTELYTIEMTNVLQHIEKNILNLL